MTALTWIYVGLIGVCGANVFYAIAQIGRPRKPVDATYAASAFIVAVLYAVLYVFTIRALS